MNANKIPDSLIKLIQRSKDIGDGWRNVSAVLSKFITEEASKNPELFELSEADGQLRVRMTERCKTLADYI